MSINMTKNDNRNSATMSCYTEYIADDDGNVNEKLRTPVSVATNENRQECCYAAMSTDTKHDIPVDSTKSIPSIFPMSNYFEYVSDDMDVHEDDLQERREQDGQNTDQVTNTNKHMPPVKMVGISTYNEYDSDHDEDNLPSMYDVHDENNNGIDPQKENVSHGVVFELDNQKPCAAISMYDEYDCNDEIPDLRQRFEDVSECSEHGDENVAVAQHKTIVSLGELLSKPHSEHGAASPTGIVSLYDEYNWDNDDEWLDKLSTISCLGDSSHGVDELDVVEDYCRVF
jgi:hypothetical protein